MACFIKISIYSRRIKIKYHIKLKTNVMKFRFVYSRITCFLIHVRSYIREKGSNGRE